MPTVQMLYVFLRLAAKIYFHGGSRLKKVSDQGTEEPAPSPTGLGANSSVPLLINLH